MRAAAQGKASSRQRVVRKAHSTRAAAAHERNIQTRDYEPCDHQAHHARGQNSSQNPGKVVHRSKSPGRRNGSRNRAKGLRTRSCAIIPDSQSVERRAEGTRESEALKPVQVRCLKETSLPTTPERQASKTFGKLTASSTFPPTAFTTTAFTGVSSSSVSSGSTDDDDDDEDEWVKLPRQHGWALLPRRGLDANTIPHLEPEADPRRRATVSLLFQGHRRRKQGQLGQHRHDDEDASSPADKASATTVRRGRGLSGNASKRPNVPYSTLQAVLFRCTVAKNGWLSSKDSYPVRRLDKSRSVHNATSNRAATL